MWKLFQSLLNRVEELSQTSHKVYKPKEASLKPLNAALCEFDQNKVSVYFDEVEHYFIENGQKQHTWEISTTNIQVMFQGMAS